MCFWGHWIRIWNYFRNSILKNSKSPSFEKIIFSKPLSKIFLILNDLNWWRMTWSIIWDKFNLIIDLFCAYEERFFIFENFKNLENLFPYPSLWVAVMCASWLKPRWEIYTIHASFNSIKMVCWDRKNRFWIALLLNLIMYG